MSNKVAAQLLPLLSVALRLLLFLGRRRRGVDGLRARFALILGRFAVSTLLVRAVVALGLRHGVGLVVAGNLAIG
jgi:hypothetical protein